MQHKNLNYCKTAGQINHKYFIMQDIFFLFKTKLHHIEISDMSVRNIYLYITLIFNGKICSFYATQLE